MFRTFTLLGLGAVFACALNAAPSLHVQETQTWTWLKYGAIYTTGAHPGVSTTVTFQLANQGGSTLNFGSTPVSFTGRLNCSASYFLNPQTTVYPGSCARLEVDITPANVGVFEVVCQIHSNDPSYPTFRLVLRGFASLGGVPDMLIYDENQNAILHHATQAIPGSFTYPGMIFRYHIHNTGTGRLNMNPNDPVRIENEYNCRVTILQQPWWFVVAGIYQSFDIRVQPNSPGFFSFDISIDSNDPDESPYTATVTSMGPNFPPKETLRTVVGPQDLNGHRSSGGGCAVSPRSALALPLMLLVALWAKRRKRLACAGEMNS